MSKVNAINNIYSPNYVNGFSLTYFSNEVLKIGVGSVVDSTGTVLMSTNAATTLDFTTLGPNGLDLSVVASNKIYYIYIIAKKDGTTKAVASLSFDGPDFTNLTDYVYWRRIGSWQTILGAILGIFCQRGIYNRREYFNLNSRLSAGAGGFIFISGGTATSSTPVDLSAYIPSSVVKIYLQGSIFPGAASDYLAVKNGAFSDFNQFIVGQVPSVGIYESLPLSLDEFMSFDYKLVVAASATANIELLSYEEDI